MEALAVGSRRLLPGGRSLTLKATAVCVWCFAQVQRNHGDRLPSSLWSGFHLPCVSTSHAHPMPLHPGSFWLVQRGGDSCRGSLWTPGLWVQVLPLPLPECDLS